MSPREPVVPDIKPSRDDIALRQRQMQNRKSSASSHRSSGGGLAVFALLIALAACGVSVYLFLQLEQTKKSLTGTLMEQGEVVTELQERLSVTGENASTSLAAQGVMVKENAQEIRKLWDVAYKRNRSNIASNTQSLDKLTAKLVTIEENLTAAAKALETDLEAIRNNSSGLTERVTSVEAAVMTLPAEAELRLSQNSEAILMAEKSIKDIKSSLGQLKTLKTQIDQLDNRITLMHPPAQ